MIIGIDASFLRKQNTGIGQVTTNFLKKLVEIEAEKVKAHKAGLNGYVLYLEEDVDFDLPENFRKNIFLPFWKRDDLIRKIWWEKFLLPNKVKNDGCEAFVSIYQSTTVLPADVLHLMVVHDIIPKFFPNYLNNMRKKLYWRLVERAMRKVGHIIAMSHRTEKDIVQTYPDIGPSKITVVYQDVDELFKRAPSAEESARVLKKYGLTSGYIYNGGGLEVRKNTEGVMRAYKVLLENYASMMDIPKLVISGKMMPQLAPLVADVEKLVEALDLGDHVKILGFAEQEDLPALYANAAMFVFPSHYEGFGLPVLEAMNQGTPTITSKTSSLPEVGGDSVLYCKPDDIDDMAMVMRNVLKNEKLRQTLSEKGRERAKKFSWEYFVQKVLHIIGQH
jgi:glycosyltransferase involved in cell wall biosynthesis